MHDNEDMDYNDAVERSRPTTLDALSYLILLCAVIFWPLNIFFEFTGKLCSGLTSKVVFCGVPTVTFFVLWLAMFQRRGYWAILRRGKTEREYRRLRRDRLCLTPVVIVVMALALWQATFWICRDGCANSVGDGRQCVDKNAGWIR
jgi:hypothetical protein